MSSLLPRRPSIEHAPGERSVFDLTEEETTAVFDALCSDTARSLVESLEGGPGTVSDVARDVNTSLQNAQYHLGKLREAGIVSEVGTWYSTKGREMTVYALTCKRLEFRLTRSSDETPSPIGDLNDS